MMAGKFKEYNWSDIQQLIYKDSGLDTEELQRTKGEMWYVGGFASPEHVSKTCVRVELYDKSFNERMKDHNHEN